MESCHPNFLREIYGIGMQECQQGWLSRIFQRNLFAKDMVVRVMPILLMLQGNNPVSFPILILRAKHPFQSVFYVSCFEFTFVEI